MGGRSLLVRTSRALSGSTDNTLARLVSLTILGRVGYLAAGFIGSVVLARFLGPANRGLLGLMISVSGVWLTLFTFGMPLAVIYYASPEDADQGALLGNSLLQGVVLCVVLVVASAFLYHPIAQLFGRGDGGTTWILVAAIVSLSFLEWTTRGQLAGMLMFGRFNLLLVISRLAYAVGAVVLVGVLGLGVAGGVIATGASSFVVIGGSLGPILKRGRPRLDWVLAKRSFLYGVRVQIGSIFQLTNARFDVVILQFFRPLTEVGYYVIAQTVAELVLTLSSAFQSSVLPLLSRYGGGERADETSIDSVRHHGILAGAGIVANAIVGPAIIYLAFGPKFAPAIGPMFVLLPGIWFLGMGIVIQGNLAGRARPGLSSLLAGYAAGVTILLDLVLIPPLGMYGGALGSDAAYTTFGIGSLIALHRTSGIPIRQLAVPTRADFAKYQALLRAGYRALRSSGSRAEDSIA